MLPCPELDEHNARSLSLISILILICHLYVHLPSNLNPFSLVDNFVWISYLMWKQHSHASHPNSYLARSAIQQIWTSLKLLLHWYKCYSLVSLGCNVWSISSHVAFTAQWPCNIVIFLSQCLKMMYLHSADIISSADLLQLCWNTTSCVKWD